MTAPQPLLETRTLGGWTVHAIQAGGQKLDGGAMFGVVPKPLWQKRIAPDDRNRIPLGMRCLLIEHDDGLVLIDTGAGNKESAKFHEIYGLENSGTLNDEGVARTNLEDAIAAAGYRAADVKLVINTHLHFDHAGGDTYIDAAGAVRASCPNARYVVQKGEHHWATHKNERTAASYFERSDRFDMAIDLTAGREGLDALARVMERWVDHVLGVAVDIEALTEMRDVDLAWYVGLDADATKIGDLLWNGDEPEQAILERVVGLFRLTFRDPGIVVDDVRGEPVYLILSMSPDKTIRMKPQNLVTGLPIRHLEGAT